ncbi:GGDEF domain-containing protein [Sinimarinibacterium flocculans]|uniref:diguanylate cyclase n=1 Tax=Sinimarinibacterium flocculans TaxID=985250 RepID=A0A318EAS3_9GAMM|nr:GGDEF domain-containing protein [Sinimarinibacterium flocculans]PXV69581.1 diguanylate cyclase (GGDEF)-like protein [Sinimarinibacterium flocculans]
MWRQHLPSLLLLCAALCVGCTLALSLGQPKPLSAIAWYDVLGEAVTLLVACGWLGLVVAYRPRGWVSHCLIAGTGLLIWSYALDLFDEFFKYVGVDHPQSLLESAPAPFGMLLLTVGVAGWMREQRIVHRQLTGREHFLRDHRLLDPLTKLYNRRYLQHALERELELRKPDEPLSLLVIDVEGFAGYNHRRGAAAGDRLLVRIAEWVLIRMRPSSLLCRYGGDRFVMLLPDTPLARAARLARHLQTRFPGAHDDAEDCTLRCSAHVIDGEARPPAPAELMSALERHARTDERPQWNPA